MKTNVKRSVLLTIVLVALIALTVVAGVNNFASNCATETAYASWSGAGTGAIGDPYQIGTKAQLEVFRDIVNGNGQSQNRGACAVLTADIDLDCTSSDTWSIIAPGNAGANSYVGVFDGAGHTISDVYVAGTENNQGFFGYCGEGSVIKNLAIGGTVACDSAYYVGGIVGKCEGTVQNCVNNATVTGGSQAGGIVGYLGSTGNIVDCVNNGAISADSYAGGIVGVAEDLNTSDEITSVIRFCYNTAAVAVASNFFAGGIAGEIHNALVTNCYNTAAVSGTGISYVGGIVGRSDASTIRDCYNTGAVSANGDGISGIAGASINNSSILYCYNAGTVTGNYADKTFSISYDENTNTTFTGNYSLSTLTVDKDNSTELTAAQFAEANNFTAFDFNTVWTMYDSAPHLVRTFVGYYDKDASDIVYGQARKILGVAEPVAVSVYEPANDARFEKTGYGVAGWSLTDGGAKAYDFNDSYTGTDTLLLYPYYTTVNYNITYTGVTGATNTNPSTYTIETETITLSDPSKTGYTFTGWTTTGVDTPTKALQITLGSTGAKAYEAHWVLATPTVSAYTGYSGTYDGNGHNVSITLSHDLAVTYHYQWKKNGVDIEGATSSTYTVQNVADSDTYSVEYSATLDLEESGSATQGSIVVAISQKSISGATITLADTTFTYDGTQHTKEVTSVVIDDLTVTTYEVTGNQQTGAGNHTLTVTASGNFTGTATKGWSIAKSNLSLRNLNDAPAHVEFDMNHEYLLYEIRTWHDAHWDVDLFEIIGGSLATGDTLSTAIGYDLAKGEDETRVSLFDLLDNETVFKEYEGVYADTWRIELSSDNYSFVANELDDETFVLIIDRKEMFYNPDDAEKDYGEADGAIGLKKVFMVSHEWNDTLSEYEEGEDAMEDDLEDFAELVQLTFIRQQGENAGTYAINDLTATLPAFFDGLSPANFIPVVGTPGTFTINKVAASLTAAPTKNTGLTYNGDEQALVTAGSCTGGTLMYKVNSEDWTETVAVAKDASTSGYTVYYKVEPDENHTSDIQGTIENVVVSKRSITLKNVNTAPIHFVYDENPHYVFYQFLAWGAEHYNVNEGGDFLTLIDGSLAECDEFMSTFNGFIYRGTGEGRVFFNNLMTDETAYAAAGVLTGTWDFEIEDASGNYTFGENQFDENFKFYIDPKPVYFTPADGEKDYGEADGAFTLLDAYEILYIGDNPYAVAFDSEENHPEADYLATMSSAIGLSFTREQGENAGEYAINALTCSSFENVFDENYVATIGTAGTFTINKVDASLATAPTKVTGLVYNGSAQDLVTAGSGVDGGTLKYSLNGTDWSETVPQQKDANTSGYTVYYKVEPDGNHTSDIQGTIENITIAQRSITLRNVNTVPIHFVYDENPSYIYNQFITWGIDHYNVNEGGDFLELIDGTLAEGDDFMSIFVGIISRGEGQGRVTLNNLMSTPSAYAAYGVLTGTWDFEIEAPNNYIFGENEFDENFKFIVDPKPIYFSPANAEKEYGEADGIGLSEAYKFMYDGNEPMATFVGEKTAIDDMSTLASDVGLTFSREQGENVGEYVINGFTCTSFSNRFNGNYVAAFGAPATLTINKVAASLTAAPTAKENLVYNGTAQDLVTAGSGVDGGTMMYKVGDGDWTESVAVAKDANTSGYTVYYKVEPDGNHTSDIQGTIENIVIGKKSITVTFTGTETHYATYLDMDTWIALGAAAGEDYFLEITGKAGSDPTIYSPGEADNGILSLDFYNADAGFYLSERADIDYALYLADAGTYDFIVTLANDNYVLSSDIVLNEYAKIIIRPWTIWITPTANQGKTYGEADTTITYSVGDAASGETIVLNDGALSYSGGSGAGEHPITLGTLALTNAAVNANYELQVADVKYTIAKRPVAFKNANDSPIRFTYDENPMYLLSQFVAWGETYFNADGDEDSSFEIISGGLAPGSQMIEYFSALPYRGDGQERVYLTDLMFSASDYRDYECFVGFWDLVLIDLSGNYDLDGSMFDDQFKMYISPKPIYFTPDDAQKNYGEADGTIALADAYEITHTGDDPNEEFAVSTDHFDELATLASDIGLTFIREEGETAGEYAINNFTVTSFANRFNVNYVAAMGTPATFTVNAKPITVTITPATSTYGAERAALSATITSGSLEEGDADVYSLDCEVTATSGVGYYNVVGTTVNGNYDITFVGQTNAYQVTQKSLTVTAKPKTITYGDEPTNDGVVYDGFVNGQDESVLTGALGFGYDYHQYDQVSDATHAYAITPNGYDESNGNYLVSFVPGVLTVNKATLTVAVDAKEVTYGDAAPAYSVTITGYVKEGETQANVVSGAAAFTCDYEQYDNVSEYAITATQGTLSATNYDFAGFTPATLTVAEKAITVTIVTASSVYGDARAALTATTEPGAIVNNDENVYSLDCGVTAESNVGYYNIVGADTSTNYAVSFTNGTNAYEVTARVIGIEWAHTADLVYNKTAQKPTATATNLKNGDEVALTVSGAQTAAGTGYIATASFASAQTNYALPVDATTAFAISAKPITVTIVTATSTYGDARAALTATTVPGAIEEGDTDVYSLDCDVDETTDAGHYDIVGTALDDNYDITFAGEQEAYEVTARVIGIEWANNENLVYDKTAQKPTATATGLVNGDEVALTVGGEQTAAGTGYIATASFTSAQINYALPADATTTFDIAEKAITVAIESKTSVYGSAHVALTATTVPGAIESGDVDVYSLSCAVTANSNAGLYDIAGADLSGNYAVTFTGGENAYSVTKKALTITAKDKTITYGDEPTNDGAYYDGFVNGETSAVLGGTATYAYTYEQYGDVGEYVITVSGLTSDNYDITFVPGTLTVAQKEVVLSMSAMSAVEGNVHPATATLTGALQDDEIEINIVYKSGNTVLSAMPRNPGAYVATASIDETNYYAEAVTVDFIVRIVTIEQEAEENPEEGSVEISTDNGFDPNAILTVRRVERGETKYYEVKGYADKNEAIAAVYDVKLLLGEAPVQLDEPITIKMYIPQNMRDKEFSVINVSGNNYERVEYTVEGDYVVLTTSSLDIFAFVYEEQDLTWLIAVLAVLLAFAIALLVFLIIKYIKGGKKAIGAYAFLPAFALGATVPMEQSTALIVLGVLIGCVLGAAAVLFFMIKDREKKAAALAAATPAPQPVKKQVQKPAPVKTLVEGPKKFGNAPERKTAPAPIQKEEDIPNEIISDDEDVVYMDAEGNIFSILLNKSFTAKVIQADEKTQGYYTALKNEVLAYNKTHSRISWNNDSVNAGRNQVLKFAIKGKTLCVYLALNPDDYADTKYKVEKTDAVKYADVPCLYRIRNDRRAKYAAELIAVVCEKQGLTKGEVPTEDYSLPYETTEALIEKGLIKKTKTTATAAQIKRAKEAGKIVVVQKISVQEADERLSDEVAATYIEETGIQATGKKGIVNVDVLSRNYAENETVDLASLKKKKLIANNVGQVKLLARGKLDKKLNVELQDYSIQAVKMIILTGGTVRRG